MLEIYAKKIPIELKAEVLETINRVERNKIRAARKDVKYLFEIYKQYLAPHDKQNIDCKACRAKVCGIFFSIARTWKTKN
jgi:hypothetical protein